ncbi:MAG: polymer-forming cytoskeletal protein [Bacteroidales bacterium]|nr:polymer-forming cytoskeletal protein [Bacteroidales bacterium]
MAKHDVSVSINEISRISVGTEVKGNLVSKSDIRIDGTFEGDLVTTGKLVVGESAVVRGNIICASADIWGAVEGEFCSKESITFKSSGKFTGNLRTNKICIEMGAGFSGNCTIISDEEFTAIASGYFEE